MTAIGLKARDEQADTFARGVAEAIRARGRNEITTRVETREEILSEDALRAIAVLGQVQEQLKAVLEDLVQRVTKLENAPPPPANDNQAVGELATRVDALEKNKSIVDDHHDAINSFVAIADGLATAIKEVKSENDMASEGIARLLTIVDNMQTEIKQAAGVQ